MKIWRVDSNTYDTGCSGLFMTQKAAEAEVARIKKGWNLARTFITECEDIWGWIDGNLIMYIENLIGEHTRHTDESNWHYLMISSAEFYDELEKIFCHSSIDDYSILMECVPELRAGRPRRLRAERRRARGW